VNLNKLLVENGFSDEPKGSANACYMAHTHKYVKGEMFLRHLRDTNETAIVLEGTVLLVNVNADGQKSILDICREGDAFGGGIFPKHGLGACYAVAKTACLISYVDYGRLIHCCENSCDKHADLIDYLLGTAARRSVAHIDILSRRSIREKLMTAFGYLLDRDNNSEQTLPLSLSELADYLCCDRSAMMRELKKLNSEGLIRSHGNKITIIELK